MKKQGLILLSHCILNKFSKVLPSNQRDPGKGKLLTFLLNHNIGIIQLPCPEIHMYGVNRWGHVREQFDTPFFRDNSRKLLEPTIMEIEEYTKNDYMLLGVIGIEGSPSCGINMSCSSPEWGGEFKERSLVDKKLSTLKYAETKGIFMEVLEEMLASIGHKGRSFALANNKVDELITELKSYLSEIDECSKKC